MWKTHAPHYRALCDQFQIVGDLADRAIRVGVVYDVPALQFVSLLWRSLQIEIEDAD